MIKTVTSGKTYLFLSCIILFVIQNRLQQWFEPFQYLDEVFAVLFFPALAFWVFKKKNKIVWTRKRIIFLALLLTIGLVLDLWTEKANDGVKYSRIATQEDFDKF